MTQAEISEEFAQKIVLALIEKDCFELGNLKAYAEYVRRRNSGELPNKPGMENYVATAGYETAAKLDAAPIVALYDALTGGRPNPNDLMADAHGLTRALRELGIFVPLDRGTV